MNKMPPAIAVADLPFGLPSMKWVHFIPTMEINNATEETKMLNSITTLVTRNSTRGQEERMLICSRHLIDTACDCWTCNFCLGYSLFWFIL